VPLPQPRTRAWATGAPAASTIVPRTDSRVGSTTSRTPSTGCSRQDHVLQATIGIAGSPSRIA